MFHLHVSRVSRRIKRDAASQIDYIARTGRYKGRGDEVRWVESMNMPDWAGAGHHTYWTALDTHPCRINARLLYSVEVALPRQLDVDAQDRLAREFASRLAADSAGRDDGKAVPLTMAIHEGVRGDDALTGRQRNPHLHIKLSVSVNDGLSRPAQQWFRRANPSAPARGGAPRSTVIGTRRWLIGIRELWASLANAALVAAGFPGALDHRSHRTRGLDVLPTRHLGPRETEMLRRGQMGPIARRNERIRRFNAALLEAARARKAAQAKMDAEIAAAEEELRSKRREADNARRALHHALEDSDLAGDAQSLLACSSLLLVSSDPAAAARGAGAPDLPTLQAAASAEAGDKWLVMRVRDRVFLCEAESGATIALGVGLIVSDSTAAGVGAMAARIAARAGFQGLVGRVKPTAASLRSEIQLVFDEAGVHCKWRTPLAGSQLRTARR